MRRICALFLVVVTATSLIGAPIRSANGAKKNPKGTNEKKVSNSARKKKISISPALLHRLQFQKKDPFLAGLLSVPMWGLGHFYAREYTKGSLFVFGDLIYKTLLLGLVLKLNNKYTSDTLGDDSVTWGELSASDKTLVIGCLVTYVGITIWAALDASASARQYNRRFDLRKHFDLSLRQDTGSLDLLLGWNLRF